MQPSRRRLKTVYCETKQSTLPQPRSDSASSILIQAFASVGQLLRLPSPHPLSFTVPGSYCGRHKTENCKLHAATKFWIFVNLCKVNLIIKVKKKMKPKTTNYNKTKPKCNQQVLFGVWFCMSRGGGERRGEVASLVSWAHIMSETFPFSGLFATLCSVNKQKSIWLKSSSVEFRSLLI